jgi:FtsH-binding integral membrane protein
VKSALPQQRKSSRRTIALSLYLNFINLFMMMLRLMGGRR